MHIRPFRNQISEDKKNFAKELRKNQTIFEEKLWFYLRGKKLGIRFRRQAPILGYIVDFYCPRMSLIIEVDGSIHLKQKDYDRIREGHLRQHGFSVIRFTNDQVVYDMPGVLYEISKTIR